MLEALLEINRFILWNDAKERFILNQLEFIYHALNRAHNIKDAHHSRAVSANQINAAILPVLPSLRYE